MSAPRCGTERCHRHRGERPELRHLPRGHPLQGRRGRRRRVQGRCLPHCRQDRCPVVPVAISGARGLFETNGNRCHARAVCASRCMSPIQTAGMSKAEQKQLPDAVRQTILAATVRRTASWQAIVTSGISTRKTLPRGRKNSIPAKSAGPTGGIITSSGSSYRHCSGFCGLQLHRAVFLYHQARL